jgi:hypothetical protein
MTEVDTRTPTILGAGVFPFVGTGGSGDEGDGERRDISVSPYLYISIPFSDIPPGHASLTHRQMLRNAISKYPS